MKNCRPANAERPTTARISSVQFHPGAQVVMVSGVDNAISLFQVWVFKWSLVVKCSLPEYRVCGNNQKKHLYFLQVDGKTNPKIQSIYLEKFPIFKACFSANGEEVLATSMHSKVLYVYDMLAGKLIPVHQVRGKTSVEHTVGHLYLSYSFSQPEFASIYKYFWSQVCVCDWQADTVSLLALIALRFIDWPASAFQALGLRHVPVPSHPALHGILKSKHLFS